jgi:hypothetical protein
VFKSKKFIIGSLLTIVVVAVGIGGAVLADDPEDSGGSFLDRVAAIYEQNTNNPIDAQELQKAMTQARDELKAQARDQFRQKLIDDGVMTEEQLNEWEAWLAARPDFPTDEYQQWLESRPEGVPFGPGMPRLGDRGFQRFGGGPKGFMRGGFHPCAPAAPPETQAQ